jgi:ankyrin repeat protein
MLNQSLNIYSWLITSLATACRFCEFEIVKMLIEAGADPNLPSNNGYTPLLYLIRERNDIKLIKYLIDAGADVN